MEFLQLWNFYKGGHICKPEYTDELPDPGYILIDRDDLCTFLEIEEYWDEFISWDHVSYAIKKRSDIFCIFFIRELDLSKDYFLRFADWDYVNYLENLIQSNNFKLG